MCHTSGSGYRGKLAAALAAVILLAGTSLGRSQEVVALVDGVPITQFDIAQRSKLEQLGTQKPPPRDQILNALIDESLELHEAKRFGIDVPESEVDSEYAEVAKHMGLDPQKLSDILAHSGSSADALKHRLKAQIAWNALVRGRYKASLEIADTDVEAQLHLHPAGQNTDVGYEYTLRPIVFVVPSGSPVSFYESRKREAEALRARFADCTSGIPFARALNEVAVREQVVKFSAELPQHSRDILDGTEVGHLTPPEQMSEGLQMFAVCAKRQTKSDTPEHKKVRDELFQKKFGAEAARYLKRLRREAMIEYK
ncbi:MAG: SurA N-terminal domain-containing protein [Xanthobacteraceae bacterium]